MTTMTKEQIDAIPRKEARQIFAEIPAGKNYDDRLLLAVELALNLEWWRGYHAALALTKSYPHRKGSDERTTSGRLVLP